MQKNPKLKLGENKKVEELLLPKEENEFTESTILNRGRRDKLLFETNANKKKNVCIVVPSNPVI